MINALKINQHSPKNGIYFELTIFLRDNSYFFSFLGRKSLIF